MENEKEKYQYKNEIYLRQQFIELCIPAIQIAKNNNIGVCTIHKWLRKFNIKKEKPLYNDEVWLRKQYITLKKSIKKLSIECKANESTISQYLKIFKIPIRPKKEATKLALFQRNKLYNNGYEIKQQYRTYKNDLITAENNFFKLGIME